MGSKRCASGSLAGQGFDSDHTSTSASRSPETRGITRSCARGPIEPSSWARRRSSAGTADEEALLCAELALFPQQWSFIIQRHGKDGTESRGLAERTAVNCKDKARTLKAARLRAGLEIDPWMEGGEFLFQAEGTSVGILTMFDEVYVAASLKALDEARLAKKRALEDGVATTA